MVNLIHVDSEDVAVENDEAGLEACCELTERRPSKGAIVAGRTV
ncbi:MAG TPA: hypothetical protein VF544_11345 [Pyrinomonadaceae bacterium]